MQRITAHSTMILLQAATNSPANLSILAIITLIGTLVGTLITLVGTLSVAYVSFRNNQITADLQRDLGTNTVQLQRELARTNIDDKRLEARRLFISKRLDEFYAPLQQYLNKSHELSIILYKGKPKNFRTLTYLLDPTQVYSESNSSIQLSENDQLILAEIIKIGEKIENLIIDKAGLVDDPQLSYRYTPNEEETDVNPDSNSGLLAILGTHLLIIRYAYEKKLKGQAEEYQDHVFPREINAIIKENIDRLNNELLQLSAPTFISISTSTQLEK